MESERNKLFIAILPHMAPGLELEEWYEVAFHSRRILLLQLLAFPFLQFETVYISIYRRW
jgi:hypothetical protein